MINKKQLRLLIKSLGKQVRSDVYEELEKQLKAFVEKACKECKGNRLEAKDFKDE